MTAFRAVARSIENRALRIALPAPRGGPIGGTRATSVAASIIASFVLGCGSGTEPPGSPKGPTPASIDLAPANDTTAPSAVVHITATTRDEHGTPLTGLRLTWTSSDNAVASVDTTGAVTAGAPGQARIAATIGALSASTTITVLPPLVVSGTDSTVVRDAAFTIHGTGFTTARFALQGQPLPAQIIGDTIARLTASPGLFEPCVPADARVLLTIDNAAKEHVERSVALAAVPLSIQLAPGEDRILSGSPAGCELHVASAGEYVAIPFVRDRPGGRRLNATDSVSVRVVIGATPAAARAALRAPLPVSADPLERAAPPLSAAVVSDVVPFSREPLLTRHTAAATTGCALPTQLDDTVTVQTSRYPWGQLLGPGGYVGYGPSVAADEPWSVAAISSHVIVFTDTQTLREMASDAKLRGKIQGLATVYDSILMPFYAKWTRGIPDKDSTGKLIVYVGDAKTLPNWANVLGTGMRRCPGSGESIFLNAVDAILPLEAFIHEVGHVADLGWSTTLHAEDGMYEEGTATFFATLYQQGNSDTTLFANASAFGAVDGITTFCVLPRWQTMSGPYSVGRAYPFGCFVLGYLLQRRIQTVGGSLHDALAQWGARGDSVLTITRAAAALGIPNAPDVFPEFLASWYADDYVSGSSPALQITMWNVREIMQTPGISSQYQFVMPDLAWSNAGGDATFAFGAPDARFVQFEAGANTALILRRTPATFDPSLIGVTILRTR